MYNNSMPCKFVIPSLDPLIQPRLSKLEISTLFSRSVIHLPRVELPPPVAILYLVTAMSLYPLTDDRESIVGNVLLVLTLSFHMWKSQVEIKHYSYQFLTTFLMFMCL